MPTPDPTLTYTATNTALGNHCVAGAGFDVIRPAAELLCRRELQPSQNHTITEDLRVDATAGKGVNLRGSVISDAVEPIAGHDVQIRAGILVAAGTRDGGELKVGMRGDVIGRQGAGPNEYRPYIEVYGSSREGSSSVGAGACTDTKIQGMKFEVCGGVTKSDGSTVKPQITLGKQFDL